MQASSIQIQKTFPFPVDRIFQAWTDGEELKSWWKPSNFNLTESKTDVKTGGIIEYRFRNEAVEEASLTGSYRDVQPNALLDYDWTWEVSGKPTSEGSKQHITIRFTADGEGCTVAVTQEQEAELEQESVQHSWEEAFENLKTYLSSQHTAS
jgi:uncharacterized protein YndB with AHSA1/START domain